MTGKVKVVFASLLKPVDEARMYAKLARSLAKTNKYDLNIIGFASKNLPNDPQVSFWPLFSFKRISPGRLLAPLKFLQKVIQLKPEVLVLTSPDFLIVSALYKILFGCQLLYDVQENYYRNIIWSHGKPSAFRRIRASLVRSKEQLLNRMIIQFIIAERCYENECSFINERYLVLENKALKPAHLPAPRIPGKAGELRFLFSGTISDSYGILDSLPLLEAIYSFHPRLRYTICGHCPNPDLARHLEELTLQHPWIELIISSTPLPHKEILHQLEQAHFSLVAYRLNPSNENCIPTRIWEALAWKTPMIMRAEHPWKNLAEQYKAGFSIDFLQPDIEKLKLMLYRQDYYTQPLPDDIYWESQEQDWLKLMASVSAKHL